MKMRQLLCTIFITALMLSALVPLDSVIAQKKDLKEIRREAEKRYITDDTEKKIRSNGDYIVDRDDEIVAHLIITDGNIEIEGTVRGTVIAIDGDVIIASTGTVRGDVIAISGEIIRRTGAVVTGDEIETSWRRFVQRRSISNSRDERGRRRWQEIDMDETAFEDFDPGWDDENVNIRYNRVEGLFLGTRMLKPDWDDGRLLYLYGEGGYGFKSKEWRYKVGLERRFFDENVLTFGGKFYELTESEDWWRIGKIENWLAAAFIREDFFDYYERRGFTAYISQQIDYLMKFQLEYRIDNLESMANHANWSLFGGDKKFRPNPLINEGEIRSINFSYRLDTRNKAYRANKGWFIKLDTEYTSPDLNSDFDYERYLLDVRSYVPLSRYENLNMRIMLGSSKGALPIQKGFYLGGIGTMPGIKYKDISGTSMALANVEYVFDPYRIMAGPPMWVLEDFRIAFFGDIGIADYVEVDDFSDMLSSSAWVHDVGIGMLSQDEAFRVDFAWRTDEQGQPLKITFRINRSF